jgi:hypothetical protein
VVRGGSWNNNSNNARASYCNRNNPNNRNNNIGFRVVVGVAHVCSTFSGRACVKARPRRLRRVLAPGVIPEIWPGQGSAGEAKEKKQRRVSLACTRRLLRPARPNGDAAGVKRLPK